MKTALIVKIGAIGDAIMALPLARALKERGFDEVHWLAGQGIVPILKIAPEITNRIVIDETKLFGGKFSAISEILKTWKRLPSSFDEIYILQGDRRYSYLIPPWISRKKIHWVRDRTRRHHTFDYARLAFPKKEDNELSFAPYIRTNKSPPARKANSVCIFPGGAKNALRDDPLRRWPVEHFVALSKMLLGDGYEVTVLGSPGDSWIEPSFGALKSKLNWQVGKTSLAQTLTILQQSRLAISHDSGPIHLASLVDCPVISLFGPTLGSTVAPLKYMHLAMSLEKPLPCQPCYDGRDYGNCTNNLCLKQLTPESVMKKVSEFFATNRYANR